MMIYSLEKKKGSNIIRPLEKGNGIKLAESKDAILVDKGNYSGTLLVEEGTWPIEES